MASHTTTAALSVVQKLLTEEPDTWQIYAFMPCPKAAPGKYRGSCHATHGYCDDCENKYYELSKICVPTQVAMARLAATCKDLKPEQLR